MSEIIELREEIGKLKDEIRQLKTQVYYIKNPDCLGARRERGDIITWDEAWKEMVGKEKRVAKLD